jgi:hypothetical protein
MTGPFERQKTGEFTRTISNAVYSRQAISAAQSAFKQHCAISVWPQGQGTVTVSIRPIGEAANDPEQTVLEYWNYVLDIEAQRRLEME